MITKHFSSNFIMLQQKTQHKCVRCRQPSCRCALTLYLACHGLSASDLLSLNKVRVQTSRTPLFRYNGYNDRPYPPEYTSPYGPIQKPNGPSSNENVHPNGYIKKYSRPKLKVSSNEYILKLSQTKAKQKASPYEVIQFNSEMTYLY